MINRQQETLNDFFSFGHQHLFFEIDNSQCKKKESEKEKERERVKGSTVSSRSITDLGLNCKGRRG